jgi:acyl carrier protein
MRVSRIRGKGVMKQDMSSGPAEKAQTTDANAVVLEIVTEMSPSGMTEVGPDTELVAELAFDSLGLVELLAALEDALDLQPVDVEALAEMNRVADLQRIVQEAQARMPPARTPE